MARLGVCISVSFTLRTHTVSTGLLAYDSTDTRMGTNKHGIMIPYRGTFQREPLRPQLEAALAEIAVGSSRERVSESDDGFGKSRRLRLRQNRERLNRGDVVDRA